MRSYKIILLLFISASVIHLNAQTNSFGVGLSSAVSSSWNPGVELTPYLFYNYKDHQILAGPQIYGGQLGFGSIIGGEAEYRYRFHDLGSRFNLFADCNFQFVRFAIGPARNVPFSYHKAITAHLDYSMIRIRSFSNTMGIGIQYTFCKRCSLFLNGGVGYNYYRSIASPDVSASQVDNKLIGEKVDFSYTFKIGFAVKLINRD